MIRTLSTTLSILLFTVFSIAQTKSSIDFAAGNGISFRSLSNQSSNTISDSLFQLRNINEESRQNWNFTLAYNQAISDKLFFKTGLKYSAYTYYTIILRDLMWPTQHDGTGAIDPNALSPTSDLYYADAYKFIGVPILLRYHFSTKKLNPYVELGPTFNYYLTSTSSRKGSSNSSLDSSASSRDKSLKSINMFANISLGANYNCTENIQLYGQVSYSRQLNSLTTTPFTEHLYDYGIQLGVRKVIGQIEAPSK